MKVKQKKVCFCLIFVVVILCTSCSGNGDTGDVTPIAVAPELTPENENEDTPATGTVIPNQSSETSADIVLPITRQIPPPEIQAQVQWFDGGASWPMPPFPPDTPSIYISDESISDRVLLVYYSDFEPGETITTVLYTDYGYSEYLTSWVVEADLSGTASVSVFVPESVCTFSKWDRWLLYAAIGENPQQKNWDLGGWEIDLFASTMELMYLDLDFSCEENRTNYQHPQIPDSSGRFLKQLNLGEIYDGEGQSGTLISKREAHNWIYTALSGEPFRVQVLFPQLDFPLSRIGILDPEGNIVQECIDTIRGCGHFTDIITPSQSGKYTIRIDMFEKEEMAYFIRAGKAQNGTTATEITMDDLDSSTLLLGPAAGWRMAPYGYEGDTHWTYCTDAGVSNSAKWMLNLTTGYYEVFVFIPDHNAGTTQAQYRIFHNGIEDVVIVSQADYANEWVSLGKYWFVGDWQEYIYLDDNTGEPRSSNTTIAFDAVKFVYIP